MKSSLIAILFFPAITLCLGTNLHQIKLFVSEKKQVEAVRSRYAIAVAWSSDGQLAAAGEDGLYIIDANTAEAKKIADLTDPKTGMLVHGDIWEIQWSPDGSKIAYVWSEGGESVHYPENIWIVDSDGKNRHRLTPGYVYNDRRHLVEQNVDNDFEPMVENSSVSRSVYFQNPEWLPDGQNIIVSVEHIDRTYKIDSTESDIKFLEQIAVVNTLTGKTQILAEGSAPVLTFDHKIAFRGKNGTSTMYVQITPDGIAVAQNITETEDEITNTELSERDKFFKSFWRPAEQVEYTLESELKRSNAHYLVLSPDHKTVAAVAVHEDGETLEIWRVQ